MLLFFVIYDKMLCKHSYVNHRNRTEFASGIPHEKVNIWWYPLRYRPHICTVPHPAQKTAAPRPISAAPPEDGWIFV